MSNIRYGVLAPTSSIPLRALLGDKVMLAAIVPSALAAVVLGFQSVDAKLAVGASLLLLVAAGLAFTTCKATLVARLVLAFVQVPLVGLQIQLARGMAEFDFGIFVRLALLRVYMDWILIVFGAALFAVNHILFDRLQAAGLGFYCTTKAAFYVPGYTQATQ